MAGDTKNPKRLIPVEPPKRLPEAEPAHQLSKDAAFRRRSGLLHTLRHQPHRLFSTEAPSRRFSKAVRRELFYRLTASVTSFALLISLVAVGGPFFIWSGAKADTDANVTPDYSWLATYQANSSSDTAYKGTYTISTANQLNALAKLVNGLTDTNSASNPWTDSDYPDSTANYIIIAGADPNISTTSLVNMLPLISEELPVASIPVADESEPLPEHSGNGSGEETPSPEVSPAPEPSATPVTTITPAEPPAATPAASAEPSAEPTTEPAETPESQAPTLPELPTGGNTTAIALASTARQHPVLVNETNVPAADSGTESTDAPTVSESSSELETSSAPEISSIPEATEPVATPKPEPTPEPTPAPAVTPEITATAEPSDTPVETELPPPATETPAATEPLATETPTVVESLPPMPAAASATTITVPVGLVNCRILLDSDIDLVNYYGSGDFSGYSWVPIGSSTSKFLGTFDGDNHSILNFQFSPPENSVVYGLFGYVGSIGVVKNLKIDLSNPNKNWTVTFSSVLTSVGVVAADSEGTIQGCTVSNANITAAYASTAGYLGIIAAKSGGIITACTVKDSALTPTFSNGVAAVGMVAGTATGNISNSSVLNAVVNYSTPSNAGVQLSLGGILGTSSKAGITLSECLFTGKIFNTTAQNAPQLGIGGILGRSLQTVNIEKCAVGLEIDGTISNASANTRGAGGILGVASNGTATLKECFSTGLIQVSVCGGGLVGAAAKPIVVTDCYSTVSLGRSTAGGQEYNLSEKNEEGIGGLFGYLYNTSSTLTRVYYAGSLLEPQFGSIGGYNNNSILTFTNVARDYTQAPHSPFKTDTKKNVITVADNLESISGTAWTVLPAEGDVSYSPTLTWASSAEALALSKLASRQWALVTGATAITSHELLTGDVDVSASDSADTLPATAPEEAASALPTESPSAEEVSDLVYTTRSATQNAYAGSDGPVSLYRLKESETFSSLPTQISTYTSKCAVGYTLGGVYAPANDDTSTLVGGFHVPIRRKLLYALNQNDGSANIISDAATFAKFLDYVNIGGGAALGSSFTLSGTIDAGALTVPSWTATPATPSTYTLFCGKLVGENSGELKNFKFAAGATGLISNAYNAAFESFTLADIQIGNGVFNVDGQLVSYGSDAVSTTYFGVLAGNTIGGSAKNVTVQNAAYAYSVKGGSDYSGGSFGFLFGQASTGPLDISNCKVENVQAQITIPTGHGISFSIGGLVGNENGSNITVGDCTVSGRILTSTQSSYKLTTLGKMPYVGGIIGQSNGSAAVISNCNVTGDFSGGQVGGLMGRARSVTMKQSSFTGKLQSSSGLADGSQSDVGGLIGIFQHVSGPAIAISECAVLADISASQYAGGLFGNFQTASSGTITLSNSYYSGILNSTNSSNGAAGGIMGFFPTVEKPVSFYPTLDHCYFTGQVMAANKKAGGLIGSVTTDANDNISAVIPGTTAWFDTSLFEDDTTGTSPYTIGNITGVKNLAAANADELWAKLQSCTVSGTKKSDESKWETFANDASVWSYQDSEHYYPALSHNGISPAATLKLFRLGNNDTIYEITLGTTLETVLPSGVSSKLLGSSPSFESGKATIADGYTTTPYKATENAGDTMGITYDGLGFGGSDLLLQYALGVKIFTYGTGTALDPYIIPDVDTLQVFRYYIDEGLDGGTIKYFIIAKPDTDAGGKYLYTPTDIDMAGESWPVMQRAFSGVLKGNHSVIRNLNPSGGLVGPDNAKVWNAGMFYSLAADATITDLTLESFSITPGDVTDYGTNAAVGILSARSSGSTIQNVMVKNSQISGVSATAYQGGLIGYVSASGTLTVKQVSTDVSILPKYAGQYPKAGGGILGYLDGVTNSNAQVTLSECASYGPISDFSSIGGLVGSLNASNLWFPSMINSFSLSQIQSDKLNGTLNGYNVGGLIGTAISRIEIKNCYYGGQIGFTSTDTGSIGTTEIGGLTGKDGSLVSFSNTCFDRDANSQVSQGDTYGSFTYPMSQTAGTRTNVMKKWDSTVWNFTDGLYPRLAWQDANDENLVFDHIAVHFTNANGVRDAYQNLYVRYSGATLSSTNGALLLPVAEHQMLVATANGNETDKTTSLPITLSRNGQSRTIAVTPCVDSQGRADASIYFMNKSGMSTLTTAEGSTQPVWSIYTADALAGLAGAVNAVAASTDYYGIPLEGLKQGQSTYHYSLKRDLDLGLYSSWTPIGTALNPFRGQFDGSGGSANSQPGHQITGFRTGSDPKVNTAAALGLFGVIDGGEVRSVALFPYTGTYTNTSTGTSVSNGALCVTEKQTAVGAIAGVITGSATIRDCFTAVPIYGSAVNGAAVGGIVGRIDDADSMLSRCAATGYIYLTPTDTTATSDNGPSAGGLVGAALAGGIIHSSYAAGYVESSAAGGIVGRIKSGNPLTLTSVSYDGNANGSLPTVGNGGTLTAATSVPDVIGNGWANSGTETGLYPLQETFTIESAQLKSARIRMTHSSSARSATGGTMDFADGELRYNYSAQPSFISDGDRLLIADDKKSYSKKNDGLAELWVSDSADSTATQRILVNLRCWYDNYTTDSNGVRFYTIREAGELAELAEIVNGTILKPDVSKVGHTHVLHGLNGSTDFDDFSGCRITLAANIDLTTLKENGAQRSWTSIGTAHSFAGTFDGAGYAVSGMKFDQAVNATVSGLFASVSGTIQNLLVTNATLTLSGTQGAGLIAGSLDSKGQMINCGSSGVLTLNGASGSVGGIVGNSSGIVSGCFSTAEIKDAESKHSAATVGGIVGSNAGQVLNSYFAGYGSSAQSTVGGIAGRNSGAVSQSYVVAYLNGSTVYSVAPGSADSVKNCFYDGRFTAKGDGQGTEGTGDTFTPGSEWVSSVPGVYYPRLKSLVLGVDGNEVPSEERTPLAQAGDLAAAQFRFSGAVASKFNNFTTVTVSAAGSTGFLLSASSNLRAGGAQATAVEGAGGAAYLYYNAGTADNIIAKNPCYLVIPATLGVSYQFNWAELIHNANLTAGTPPTPKCDLLISTAAELQSFVSRVSSGDKFSGKTVALGADIDLSGSFTPMNGGEFLGTFDGNGHTISNYRSNAPFFSTVGVGGVVKQLCFSNASVNVSGSGEIHAAIVAGVNGGRIVNVAVEGGAVNGIQSGRSGNTYIGGLVGENLGTLETSYFYTASSLQLAGTVTESAIDTFYMGGIAGSNSGYVNGCYSSTDYQVGVGSAVSQTPSKYIGTLVGYNSGTVDYSYWRAYQTNINANAFTAYRLADGTEVPAASYYFINKNLGTVAEWLSIDTYGGAYYLPTGGNHPMLYCFELLKYDLTELFGGKDALQSIMLSLQYTSNGDDALFANGLTSWKSWQLPNFASITETSSLSLRLPMLSNRLNYEISSAVITKDMTKLDSPLTYQSGALSKDGAYTVSWTVNPIQVMFKVKLTVDNSTETPWGVYREDSTNRLN